MSVKDVKINEYVKENILNQITKTYMATNMSLYDVEDCGTKIPMFFKIVDIPNYINGEKSHIVAKSEENRLDNIAYNYYGNPEYFWVIAYVNGITNPFEVEVGTVIRLLPKSYIDYNILTYYNNKEELF